MARILFFITALATIASAQTRTPVMKIDEYGCIEMEHVSWPGSIGDSAAESARYEHLRMLLGNYVSVVNLERFVTPLGYVRHPTAPGEGAFGEENGKPSPSWRETDFSGDQALPLYLAWRRGTNFTRSEQMKARIKSAGWRTGNGDFVSPGFFGILIESDIISSASLLVQALLFKLPYRWSDSKKWFERNDDSSGDYLNFFHAAVYAPRPVRWLLTKLVPKELLLKKIVSYYDPEPSVWWLLELYEKAIKEYWV
jgi:hypothetical protein